MKRLVFLLLLLNSLSLSSQTVVYLQGIYQNTPQNLDSIRVDNLSQPSVLKLAAPPDITTYAIDLVRGSFYGLQELNSRAASVRILSTLPGRTLLRVILPASQPVRVTLYTLSGTIFRQWDRECQAGSGRLEISAGTDALMVCRISGSGFSFSFKMAGSREALTECKTFFEGTEALKHSPDFLYTPGDRLRFTAIKVGMNRGATAGTILNQDSVRVQLSMPCPGTPVVTDYDGNKYNTVQIGGQCWLKENLRSKHYAWGQPLVDGTGAGTIGEMDTTRYWFYMNDNPATGPVYGLLYTARTAMRPAPGGTQQGICPDGWHVSTTDDWCIMEKYLDSTYTDCSVIPSPLYHAQWGGTLIRDKITEQGKEHWTCSEGPAGPQNESGFTALPNCGRLVNGFYTGLGSESVWWNYIPTGGGSQVPIRGIVCDSLGDYRTFSPVQCALPVRCVKD